MTVRWHLAERHRAALAATVAAALALGFGTALGLRWSSAIARYSGYGLLVLMLVMSLLPLQRAAGRPHPTTADARLNGSLKVHERIGIVLPLALWAHAGSIGTAGMLMLAGSTLLLTALGALHPSTREPSSPDYLRLWWRLHILVACLVWVGTALHIWAMWAY